MSASKQLSEIAKLDTTKALEDIAKVILEEMQTLTPVDTGDLLESEHIEVNGENDVQIIADSDHSTFVEFGTWKMAAQPYMRPAIDSQRKKSVTVARDKVNQLIRAKL